MARRKFRLKNGLREMTRFHQLQRERDAIERNRSRAEEVARWMRLEALVGSIKLSTLFPNRHPMRLGRRVASAVSEPLAR